MPLDVPARNAVFPIIALAFRMTADRRGGQLQSLTMMTTIIININDIHHQSCQAEFSGKRRHSREPHPEAPRRGLEGRGGHSNARCVQRATLRRVLRGFGLWPPRGMREVGGCRSPAPLLLIELIHEGRHDGIEEPSDLREEYPFRAAKRPRLRQCNAPLTFKGQTILRICRYCAASSTTVMPDPCNVARMSCGGLRSR